MTSTVRLSYVEAVSPQEIKLRLHSTFPNGEVVVRDLTGTEDHYEVSVTSISFAGKSRIEQHQMVMTAFAAELKTGEVHALSIRTQILLTEKENL